MSQIGFGNYQLPQGERQSSATEYSSKTKWIRKIRIPNKSMPGIDNSAPKPRDDNHCKGNN